MRIEKFPEIEHIHPIVIELPGFGDLLTSNMYAIGKGPITLIDSAPKFPGSFEQVKKQLATAGFSFSDVERIIITHGHIDHFGIAEMIREAAGHHVDCYIHEDDVWRTSSTYISTSMWGKEAEDFAAMVDIPSRDIERMRRRSAFFRNFCDPLEDLCVMNEGDIFSGAGYNLHVIHTPGHTTGSCCLYESCSRTLFSGDHIIKHITPNPFTEIHRSHLRDPGYQSLKAYNESLLKVEQFDISYVFSGHGGYIEDLAGIISGYREHHRKRMDMIFDLLRKTPRSIYRLAKDVFPNAPDTEIFLAVSEIFVHLEILMNEGRVELSDPGPPAVYRAV
ncbi:MAG TPA: MBL fold metallo-hydrolase [Deltaproteobacteria bacterium]|nr:MBL fold metallo-hydrolase [Deltaproteobacteria bacterium]